MRRGGDARRGVMVVIGRWSLVVWDFDCGLTTALRQQLATNERRVLGPLWVWSFEVKDLGGVRRHVFDK